MYKDLPKMIAESMWETGSIKVSVDNPIKMTSGKLSPFYIDCRLLISYPLLRNSITAYAQWMLAEKKVAVDSIAGGETAGIPFAAWLAEKMNLPFVYVRKKPKGHGLTSQVEGRIEPGQSVLLYEDLITDGLSKINFLQGIRNAGGKVEHCLVVLDRLEGGEKKLAEENVKLYAVVTMDQCFDVGLKKGYLSEKEMAVIRSYLEKGSL
ncbi:MAG: orotate phosphoribosyltransferase [Desulfobacterales bacterium]|nr:orotate phosphoribosyltransferase [Desulfobacterales bacterium]